ncbi:class I SAM-dependent methyltransferase [Pseudonocardia kongjuensis]|uniref:Class I SAM-dependent methyltransferase n=1 Tax=Pseudonocardia kongjuensis TaxID=102227 RepID=A0ABN1XPX2_9PSEU
MVTDPDGYTTAMRSLWGGADYRPLAARLAPASRALVDTVAPGDTEQVLDVAAGTGTAALMLRERGAAVLATDLAPRMVELGRERTAGTGIVWLEADAEDLPLPDGSADVVVSSFGLIFAPRPETALAELRRVLAPGGRLAFTAWTPDGFMGRMTTAMRAHTGTPPGVADPLDWGVPDTARRRLAGFAGIRISAHRLPWHFDSPAAMTTFLRRHSPAHAAAAAGLGGRASAMFDDVEALAGPADRPVRLDAEFLVVDATAPTR